MGAAESTGIQTSGYEYLKKADKGVYGDAKVYSKRGQRDLEYVIKEKFMEDERTRVKFENYIEENLKHEKIEFFTTREAGVVQNKGNFCGTCASSTKLVVDWYPEPEIWYVLKSLFTMELFLEKKRNEYHQGLSTSKVFVSEQGKILFLDPFFDFSCNTPYAKNMLGLAKNCLPPELMNCLKNYNPNPPIDPIKTEAWTIGLILLCMATLTVEHDYYDFESSKVLTNRINSSISSLGSRYSPLFKELLVSCLEVNPSRRASMAMIKEYLVMRSRL